MMRFTAFREALQETPVELELRRRLAQNNLYYDQWEDSQFSADQNNARMRAVEAREIERYALERDPNLCVTIIGRFARALKAAWKGK